MSLSRRAIRGAWGKIVLASLGTPLALLVTDGCTQQQTETSLRSLEHSGRVSFVCLSAPGAKPSVGRSILDCSGNRYESPSDYGVVDGATTQPHLYALVTQTTRGEVAVVDMSTKANSVLDQNPQVPGANFLPIGSQPVDIVSTNDGDATFVAVAEIGRQGIFALPSEQIRSCPTCAPKKLSDWPVCALPGAPGNMLIVDDPPVGETMRASCTGSYEPIGDVEKDKTGNSLIDVTDGKVVESVDPNTGTVKFKKLGRPKIVVTVPERGALAIIDAQTLFEPERDVDGKPKEGENGVVYKYAGTWQPCPIEWWQPLEVKLPVSNPPPAGTGGPTCADRPVPPPAPQIQVEPWPAGLALSDNKLFVADSKAPVVHVIDMKTPCEPVELEPLLPTSRENPSRVVTTNTISVSAKLATTQDQFVYAVDDYDGSLMVFDVGPNSTSRLPVSRPHEEWTPSQPPDRVDFGVPVQDLVLIERDNPQPIPATGIAIEGVRCDPDPTLALCTSDSMSCDPGTLYRPSSDFDRGAGPTRMRGAFAYLVLSTGQIAAVDIDDYDKNCRMPRQPSYLNGCPEELFYDNDGKQRTFESSGEVSCNVVVPHTPRDANYMRSGERIGQNQPGIQNFPTLYSHLGTPQAKFDPDAVVMRAPLPAPPKGTLTESQFTLAVGSSIWPLDAATGLIKTDDDFEHAVASNWEDPRAHTTNQAFSVIYEGALPGFGGKAAKLETMTMPATLTDAASRFCDQGVLGQKAFVEILANESHEPPWSATKVQEEALKLADYVQIASAIPDEDDAHWTSTAAGKCSFEQCTSAFGPLEIPKTARDMKIIEAYQDHLELAMPEGTVVSVSDPSVTVPVGDIVDCCFATLVGFNVRVGHQWAVVGTASGFIHHVIPTPLESSTADRSVGVCRNSCDPRDARKNGRVRSIPHGEPAPTDKDQKQFFINPFFRFAIHEAIHGNAFDANPDSPDDNAPERGTFFQFNTQGSFKPLLVNLVSTTTEIQPQSIGFVPATGEVVIVDGSLEGIILLNAGRLDITRRYY